VWKEENGQRRQVFEVHINGGRLPTGQDALAWAREVERLGAGEIVLTSMDADGTQAGYDLEITKAVADAVTIPVVASGGAGAIDHFEDVLRDARASAALAASLFHQRQLTIGELKKELALRGLPMRLPAGV
jgi:cyclase